ncbi:reverse transcriptase domain-containing protein [Tanacetum coccineum]|uniref:Reverse transcriptase domain-containing protein n=1 Tax=Tanacetum coccineum TaxID=301880 RepID=A0ABQ5G752_9ASTR
MSNQTNELKNMMASFFQMNTASTSGTGSLPSKTVANPKGELKAITTRSGLVLDGPSVPMPPPFINLEEDERVEETLTDSEHGEYTIKVPPPLVQKAKPLLNETMWFTKYQKMLKSLLSNKEKLIELANTPLNENCSAVILKKLPEKLGDPGKFLIPCGFSELKCKALADLGASINLMPLSVWKKLGLPELISTQMTLELANREICTPVGIARDVFVPVGKFTFPADFVIVDYESDPRVPLILGRPFLRTARALIDVHGEEMILRDVKDDIFDPEGDIVLIEKLLNLDSTKDLPPSPNEFADELALIESFPPRNDNMTPEDIIREIEYLLNRDLLAENSPNNDLIYTIPEMFTDEHTLEYSSLPRYDDANDDLFYLKTDSDEWGKIFYDDPFDSKENKIKVSKLLVDELDSTGSSSFLPHFLECDSVHYEDFSKVDTLTSTNNEDKDFYPHFSDHALPFHIEILESETLLLFSSENEEKVFNPEILISKGVEITVTDRNYLIGTQKLQSHNILKARWRFFLALMGMTSVFWIFHVSIFIPHEQLNSGTGQAK